MGIGSFVTEMSRQIPTCIQCHSLLMEFSVLASLLSNEKQVQVALPFTYLRVLGPTGRGGLVVVMPVVDGRGLHWQ